MASAATRAKEAWQPRGGYVDPRSMKAVRFEGARPLFPAASENVHPSVVETAVRRLLALTAGDTVEGAFSECVVSALVVGQRDDALRLRADIRGLDDASVASACRLSAYEAALEAGIALHAEDVTRMRPNAATLANVRTMVESASGFLKGRRLVARSPFPWRFHGPRGQRMLRLHDEARALGRQDLGLRARRGGHAPSRHLPALGPALPLRPAFPADIGTGRREPEAPCGVRGRRGGHPACRHARDRKEGRRRRGRRVPAPAGFRTCKKAPLTRGLALRTEVTLPNPRSPRAPSTSRGPRRSSGCGHGCSWPLRPQANTTSPCPGCQAIARARR